MTAADRPRERGVALLVVLWIIASATLLVVSFNATVRSGLSFVNSEVGLSRSENLLDAGLEIAVARLIDQEPARRWLPDGLARSVPFAGHRLRIKISDPNGLIDLNKTDEKVLLEFFKQFTDTDSAARAIRDRIKMARDQAMKTGQSSSPFEKTDPTGDSNETPPPTPAFVDAAEARMIEGISADLYRKILPFLTVYSRDGAINPLSAPQEVVLADAELRGLDFTAKREAFLAGRHSDPQNDRDRNGADNRDELDPDGGFGPAYIVEVATAAKGERYSAKKIFVIATDLDANAPYRILAVKTAPKS